MMADTSLMLSSRKFRITLQRRMQIQFPPQAYLNYMADADVAVSCCFYACGTNPQLQI